MIGYTTFSFFLLYFGITWLVYSLVPQKVKWCVLLAGSYVFYFISSKGHIIPMVAASLIVWAIGLALQKLDKTCKLKRKQAEKAEKKRLEQNITNRSVGYFGSVLFLPFHCFLFASIQISLLIQQMLYLNHQLQTLR